MKQFLTVIFSSVCLSGLAVAQSNAPPATQSNQVTPKLLVEMLQSASNFHDLVQNLNKSLGPDVHTAGPDGLPQHRWNARQSPWAPARVSASPSAA